MNVICYTLADGDVLSLGAVHLPEHAACAVDLQTGSVVLAERFGPAINACVNDLVLKTSLLKFAHPATKVYESNGPVDVVCHFCGESNNQLQLLKYVAGF